MGLLLPDEAEQIPGAIRQDDAMDFRVVLYDLEKLVKGIIGTALRQYGKGALGFGHVLTMNGFAETFGAWKRPGNRRELDGVKDFFFAPAPFLDAIRVPVKDFEDRERLKARG